MNTQTRYQDDPDWLTLQLLRDLLRLRFGEEIASTVLRTLDDRDRARRLHDGLLESAMAIGMDLQAVHAGRAFSQVYPISAVRDSTLFRSVCASVGVEPEELDSVERQRIDTVFAQQWQALGEGRGVVDDLPLARAVMKSVLFVQPGVGHRAD